MVEGTSVVAMSPADTATAERWRTASLRAARVEAMPRRPGWTRVAVVAGAAGMTFGLGATAIRMLAPDVAELPWISVSRTVMVVVLGVALLVLTPWANARGFPESVLRPLTRAERRTIRRELVGRTPLDPTHWAVLGGYARQQRLAFVAAMTFAGFWSNVASTWRVADPPDVRTLVSLGFLALIVGFPVATAIPVIRQRPVPPRWG